MTEVKNEKKHTPLNIFLVNFDWRDLYRTSRIELIEKLERDRWNSALNEFLFFSWAKVSYEVLEGQYQTVHRKTYGLDRLRPLQDLRALVTLPWAARKLARPHVWSAYDFGNVPALWLCKKLYGGFVIPVINNQPVIYSKTRRFGEIKGWYSYVMERIGARLVDHVLTINATMKEYLMNIGIPENRITVFSMNTILRDQQDIHAAKAGTVRQRYALPKNAKVLLCVARLEAEKNLPTLLDCFAALDTDHVLFILGQGSLLGALQAQAKTLGISDRVYFPGYVHRNDIWNYYKDADLFVLLSNAEALGVVLWEAMYVGVPVIGSNVEGIEESLGKNGERGLIWKHGSDSGSFKELVARALTSGAEQAARLEWAKKYVEEQMQNSANINTLYEKLISR